ncbi:MAG: aldehyde dehydrogenase family protein, partial [Halobacteriales archaeon]|nr:aldehyde dehydrogenase family protein [Halobacteriales archaeon]
MPTEPFTPPRPSNEPVYGYGPGSAERATLREEIRRLEKETLDIPCVVGGVEMRPAGTFELRAPHRHELKLADVHAATAAEVEEAIRAAGEAKPEWESASAADRAAVFLRAADLLSTTRRDLINAATMLGQSKTVHQAEIDAVCEL